MNGQWVGPYEGSNSGWITLNVDRIGTYYAGTAYLLDSNSQRPGTTAQFRTSTDGPEFSFRTSELLPLNPNTGQGVDWKSLESTYPGTSFPSYADAKGKVTDKSLTLEWKTDIGTFGKCELPRTHADAPSERTPISEVKDWESFKRHIDTLDPRRYVFRGQSSPWRLRTTYHRTGRADLYRYRINDIPALLRHLSARTKHFFRLEIPDENGAFYSLIQHHGYPTPLLDWTYSPYMAAFFAYRSLSRQGKPASEKVRIFCFDQQGWRERMPAVLWLDTALPHFSILESLAIENERMIPQQSISTVTNVDDIEGFIRVHETRLGRPFLHVIDLPAAQRDKAMRDLSLMGITAGSLLPGLDGACEELRERFFT